MQNATTYSWHWKFICNVAVHFIAYKRNHNVNVNLITERLPIQGPFFTAEAPSSSILWYKTKPRGESRNFPREKDHSVRAPHHITAARTKCVLTFRAEEVSNTTWYWIPLAPLLRVPGNIPEVAVPRPLSAGMSRNAKLPLLTWRGFRVWFASPLSVLITLSKLCEWWFAAISIVLVKWCYTIESLWSSHFFRLSSCLGSPKQSGSMWHRTKWIYTFPWTRIISKGLVFGKRFEPSKELRTKAAKN